MTEFGGYEIAQEPDSEGRLYAWQIAIGLQAVDGLKPSDFLTQTANRNIAGDISIDEARHLIHEYYENRELRTQQEIDEHEADKVSANIAKLLGEEAFRLIPATISYIHECIFDGVFKFAGQYRKINISKKEWVLRGDSVSYTPAPVIAESITWDIEQELKCDYSKLNMEQAVEHIASFISALWQIHPFAEGNTRTSAVLLIKYLRFMGFAVDNASFVRHAWYFRNALVRANYHNTKKHINKEPKYLLRFLRNVLLGENHELKNRYLIIPEEVSAPPSTEQATVQVQQVTADNILSQYSTAIQTLIKSMGTEAYSLRQLMEICGLKHRPTFIENYITPAISTGIVRLLYPDKPKHPRQKYLLTVKGLLLHNG